jgi:hypothetical protein
MEVFGRKGWDDSATDIYNDLDPRRQWGLNASIIVLEEEDSTWQVVDATIRADNNPSGR